MRSPVSTRIRGKPKDDFHDSIPSIDLNVDPRQAVHAKMAIRDEKLYETSPVDRRLESELSKNKSKGK
jgi:hypothetical protein